MIEAKQGRHPLIIALSLLAGMFALSALSGYESREIPRLISWKMSPLGALLDFDPAFWNVASPGTFLLRPGFHPDYFVVFLKTCLLEAPFYFLALVRSQGWLRSLAILVAANVLTHPLIFFVFPALFRTYLVSAFSAEVFAAAGEAMLVYGLVRAWAPSKAALRAAALIVLANLVSWQIGAYW
jgi:hypothetical protein